MLSTGFALAKRSRATRLDLQGKFVLRRTADMAFAASKNAL
jgi:hypothetical protein